MQISENAKDDGFWSVIDDGPTEEEQDEAWFWDMWGHAEREWRE